MPRSSSQLPDAASPASPFATTGHRMSHRITVSAATTAAATALRFTGGGSSTATLWSTANTPAVVNNESVSGKMRTVDPVVSHVNVVRGDSRAPSRLLHDGTFFRLIVCGALIFAGLTISAAHTAEGYWQRQVRPTSSRPRADVVVDTVLLAASAPPPTKAEGRAGRRVPPPTTANNAPRGSGTTVVVVERPPQPTTTHPITPPPARQLLAERQAELQNKSDNVRVTEHRSLVDPTTASALNVTPRRRSDQTLSRLDTARLPDELRTAWRERIGMNLNGTEQPVIGVDGEATGERALQRMLVAMATPPTAESAEHRTGFHTPLKFGYRRRDGGGVRWVESPMLDVVVTYVNDTADGFAESIAATAAAAKAIVDATRFRDLGELRYLIRSLHRFGAGLIRRIVLVVADEGHVPKWINRASTEIPFAFVTHSELFPDPARELPTFNSFSIETVLHRIPGLSEYFLYFNNDMLLGRRLSLLDLFRPVAGGSLAHGAVDVETVLYMDRLDTATPCELHVQQPSNAAVEIRCNSSQRGDGDQDRAWLSTAVYAHNKELVWNRLGVFPSHAFAHIFKLFHRPRLAFMVDDVLGVESRRTRESRFRRATDLWVTMVFAYFDHAAQVDRAALGRSVGDLVGSSQTEQHSADENARLRTLTYFDALGAPECGGQHPLRAGSARGGHIVDRLSTLELLREMSASSLPLHMKQALVCPRPLDASVRCLPCVDVTNAVRRDWARRRVFGRCLPRGQGTTTATTTQNGMAAIARLMSLTKPFENADFIDRLQLALMEAVATDPGNNSNTLNVDSWPANNERSPDHQLCVRVVGPSEWLARYRVSNDFLTKIDDYAASGTASNFIEERLFAPFLTTYGKPFYYFSIAEDTSALHPAMFATAERPGRLLSFTMNDDVPSDEEARVFQIGYLLIAGNLVGRERCSMELVAG